MLTAGQASSGLMITDVACVIVYGSESNGGYSGAGEGGVLNLIELRSLLLSCVYPGRSL